MAEPTIDPGQGTSGLLRGQIKLEANGKIEPPKNIIQTLQAARTIYLRYRFDHLRRIQLYAQIEGLLAGNPPYNPVQLEQMGLGHIANFNTLDGRALFERGALAYWNLLNSTENLVKFNIRGNDPELIKFSDIMSANWDKVVRKWPSFNTLMNTNAAQIVKFGLSAVIWPDERDWKWRVIELNRFLVQDQAQADIEQLTAICVETTFTAQWLFEVYEAFKDEPKESVPWNCDELAKLLLFRANAWAGNNNLNTPFMDLMDVQRHIQNQDLCWDNIYTDDIRIVSLLYKEYDGEVSHYMFAPFYDTGDFLYFADRQYKNMVDGVVLFTASPGEFTLHSNRGLGHKLFSGIQAMMQLDCSIVDAARWSTTPLLRSLATGSKDFEAIRFTPGAPTNIGSAEFVENTMGANIQQLIGASQYILNKLQFNTANSGDDPGIPDRNQGSISNTQAKAQSYKEFAVLKNNIAHFYSQQDIVYRNMVVKMLHSKKGFPGYDEAKEWKDLCVAEGVPEQLFATSKTDMYGMPLHLEVKASRVAGDGSTLARIMGLQELSIIASGFGPREEKEYKRQWIMAALGPEYVKDFLQDSDDEDETSGGASLAQQENNGMIQGLAPLFSPDNEQRAHITIHLALGNDTIRKLQQQQTDPVAADKIFSQLIPHMQQHIKAVEQNQFAQDFFNQIRKPWMQLEEYAKLNRKNADAMLQAELKKRDQAQQQLTSEQLDQQRKDVIAQSDIKRKDADAQNKMVRGKEQSDAKASDNREKIVRDAANQRLKVQLEADTKKSALQSESTNQIREDINSLNGQTIAPTDVETPIDA